MISDHRLGQIIIPKYPIKAVKVPLKKMDYPHYCRLLQRMDMPFVRGNEDRHFYGSFEEKDSHAFLKFHPYPSPVQPDYHIYRPYPPPPGKDYALFPHRDDVPLGDPCSGLMSAGGDADLLPRVGKNIPNLVDYSDVKPQQRVPFSDCGLETEIRRRTILFEELNEDPRWNSRKVSDAAIRARLGGWTSPVRVIPDISKMQGNLTTHRFSFDDSKCKGKEGKIPGVMSEEQRVKESFYKSSTQKAYEAVPLDRIYPPKIDPPLTTFEKKADQVSPCFTLKRYECTPSISQLVGGLWDRFQTRSFTSPKRPINFVSPSSRTQYIPLYTGYVEALDPDDRDDPDGDLTSLGKARTSRILYTPTSHSTNIPKYAGKVHFTATHPANSDVPRTTPATSSAVRRIILSHAYRMKDIGKTVHAPPKLKTMGRELGIILYEDLLELGIFCLKCNESCRELNFNTLWEVRNVPNYRHMGPLSKMVTLVNPYNSFNGVVKETLKPFKKPIL
ncbi:LOW QUALITY PROTEIN: spermatogenesis-associated protein 48 [Dromiciops gliroides]|uniref:LOW QUALITY PROTEIN: spermatogenesis-associated protein 48 n=1 Tax=Dromiciops gliroides TaxID=33562 RepID=UPI001CC69D38|nr:LOW QUALITY PROTEIN: spermatogenesis-associated protein 48 [Dromiciops gliroides]